jgi:hypothetical protein
MGKALLASVAMIACLLCVFMVTSSEDTTVLMEAEAEAVTKMYSDKLSMLQVAGAGQQAAILNAIVELRAYSELAYDKAEDYKNQHSNSDMGLLSFILEFAKEAEKMKDEEGDKNDRDTARRNAEKKAKKKALLAQDKDVDQALIEGRDPNPIRDRHDIDGCLVGREEWCESLNKCLSTKGQAVCPPEAPPYNVIIEYSKAIGKIRYQSRRGIGHYLAENLDNAIMSGTSPITKFDRNRKPVIGFNSKVLGMLDMPGYFYMVSVPRAEFETRKRRVAKASSSANVAAAADWLSKGSQGKYRSFMEKQQAIKDAKVSEFSKEAIDAAKNAIHKQFEEQEGDKDLYMRLHGLAAKGINAAEKIPSPELRSQDQIAIDAQKAAAEWVKKHGTRVEAESQAALAAKKKAEEDAWKTKVEAESKKEEAIVPEA